MLRFIYFFNKISLLSFHNDNDDVLYLLVSIEDGRGHQQLDWGAAEHEHKNNNHNHFDHLKGKEGIIWFNQFNATREHLLAFTLVSACQGVAKSLKLSTKNMCIVSYQTISAKCWREEGRQDTDNFYIKDDHQLLL